MDAVRRQRAKIDGGDPLSRLSEAEVLARLATNAYRMRMLGITAPDMTRETAFKAERVRADPGDDTVN